MARNGVYKKHHHAGQCDESSRYDGSKYFQLLTFKQNDNGGNADGGGGDSSETIDDGGKTDTTKPNTDGGSYWGE